MVMSVDQTGGNYTPAGINDLAFCGQVFANLADDTVADTDIRILQNPPAVVHRDDVVSIAQ
ncbi:hypothetical protein Z946_3213 [Sulfitobacter noctilucicola]|nr:hypothetical protein Z946_3213 [Sulfitobacter noctilucicola]